LNKIDKTIIEDKTISEDKNSLLSQNSKFSSKSNDKNSNSVSNAQDKDSMKSCLNINYNKLPIDQTDNVIEITYDIEDFQSAKDN